MKPDDEIARLKAENAYLREQNKWLLEQLKLARRIRFGSSSEKSTADGRQLSMFDEEERHIHSRTPVIKEVKGYRRRIAGQVGVSRLPDDLPVELVEYELSPEERVCPECGEPLHTMGRETRDELKLVPAHAVIVRHVRHIYSCRHCEKSNDHVPVIKAFMPDPVIKGSFASPEAISHMAYEKFVMGTPLYRQEQDWARKGIRLSRQTMSGWLIRATKDWLYPIYDMMKTRLAQQEVLHADETSVQVLHEPNRTPQSKSYVWLYRTGRDAAAPIILYEYQTSRRACHPRAFLKDFRGFLHTDGYDGYHDLPKGICVVGCWAHARRRFHEALKSIPEQEQANSPPMEALDMIGQLYRLEEEYRSLTYEERFAERQRRSKPLAHRFFEWCERQNAFPRSHFGQAVSYALNQKEWLMNYLRDGRLEIDNNRAERSIRPFVMGRKNWLFCNTQEGAQVSAVLYSIIETARENGLDPFKYLAYVFRVAPNVDMSDDYAVESLLPMCLAGETL